MRITLARTDHARHIGKRLARELDLPLTRGYAIAAAVLGYESWDDMLSKCNWQDHFYDLWASWPDSQCMPLAVARRRAFQVETLSRSAEISLARANEIVQRIAPSDGFRRQHHNSSWSGEESPRLVDPKLSRDDHEQMGKACFALYRVGGMRGRLESAIGRLLHCLEHLAAVEWPATQFGESLAGQCHGLDSPHYVGVLRGAPKWITQETFERCVSDLHSIRSRIGGIEIDGLQSIVTGTTQQVARILKLLEAWRATSRAHDGEPITYAGTPPIEDDALELLFAHGVISPFDRFVLGGAGQETERIDLLSRIAALPAHVRDGEPLRYATRKLRTQLARSARWRRLQEERRQPMVRSWDLWAVDDNGPVICLGSTEGTSSLDAISSGPHFANGRVVAIPAGSIIVKANRGDALSHPTLERTQS